MNILLISGSPRKCGNTATIIQHVSERLKMKHTLEIYHITDYHINGCLGCNHCQSVLDELGCVQNDDVTQLLGKVMDADVVLYGTPLYGHSYSGQLKLLMDRHVALFKFVGGSDKAVDEMEIMSFIKNKPVGLIVSCQGPEENNTELVQMQFRKFCESSLASCLGTYIFPWCSPDVADSQFSETTIDRIFSDLEVQNKKVFLLFGDLKFRYLKYIFPRMAHLKGDIHISLATKYICYHHFLQYGSIVLSWMKCIVSV